MSLPQRLGFLATVAIAVLVGSAWQGGTVTRSMPKWEYKEVKSLHGEAGVPDDADAVAANKLGAQGWELVAVDTSAGILHKRLYFKRPLP